MRCVKPLKAYQHIFTREVVWKDGSDVRAITLPCGNCIECRLEKSRSWAVRCMHEASMYDVNSYVTLTYDDSHMSNRGSLDYSDFQYFIDRVRKRLGPVRYYMCGEYGDVNWRPHFHACLFGIHFHDRVFLRYRGKFKLYRSPLLEDLWPNGFSSIGDVTFESAAYIARYITKKITGDLAKDHYRRVDPETGEVYYLNPEFCHMSLKPGIGARWFDKYRDEVFPADYVIVRGVKCKPPKRYKDLLKLIDADVSDEVDWARLQKAASIPASEDTPERLAVREACSLARLSLNKREL